MPVMTLVNAILNVNFTAEATFEKIGQSICILYKVREKKMEKDVS